MIRKRSVLLWEAKISITRLPLKRARHKNTNSDFSFETLKSSNDELKEKGSVVGALGSMGKLAKNEKSEFVVDVSVDVKSAVLDPTEEVDVKLV